MGSLLYVEAAGGTEMRVPSNSCGASSTSALPWPGPCPAHLGGPAASPPALPRDGPSWPLPQFSRWLSANESPWGRLGKRPRWGGELSPPRSAGSDSSHSTWGSSRLMLHTPLPLFHSATLRTPAWVASCARCWDHSLGWDSVPALGSLHSSWRDKTGDEGDRVEARTSWRPQENHQEDDIFSVISRENLFSYGRNIQLSKSQRSTEQS